MRTEQTGILNSPWEFSLLSADQITDIPPSSGYHIWCVLVLLYVRICDRDEAGSSLRAQPEKEMNDCRNEDRVTFF